MALDPISAVGLAAGILQFIDFTSRLVSVGREITESYDGTTVEHSDIEAVTRNLVDDITPELLDGLKFGTALDQLRMEILKVIPHSPNLPTDWQERFSANLSMMTDQERELYFRSQLLEELSFHDQQEREYRINDAHRNTFHWIFEPPEQSVHRPWSNFESWLQGDNDRLYWITGKAGSGKSTLMKFIVHEDQCLRSLKRWSGNLPLVVTRFYFWNSGSQDQMSQEGLLRSILHDALSQRPQLIPSVLARRWRAFELYGSDKRP
ncbi:hypothetical protein G7Z17_g2296 [Cylindrodendrum hubeiense]|uniref:Nephrocystin 3-like N-terminal domain-containing protein n=1 Tax=Cylindrodendrum hubeiense TaxID=595255 RepID=A0A9P5LL69_9HYPO|nr:hypothetical protein G7Z17_g2296 [Cylindrodendrum hubeiense]